MALTDQQRAELKALAAYWQSSHPILCKGTLALLADLEEAERRKKQLEGALIAEQEHVAQLEADLAASDAALIESRANDREAMRQLAESQAREADALKTIADLCCTGTKLTAHDFELIGLTVDTRASGADALQSALSAAIEAAVEPYKRDAERWRNLKPYYTAAVFDPEREDGLDLGKGVALVFMLPEGSSVSADSDATIDAIRARQNKEATEI